MPGRQLFRDADLAAGAMQAPVAAIAGLSDADRERLAGLLGK
jgi:hypothetical protein